ncbi:MAG: orotidine-5-phosphate decarboxylase [Moorella sp. (in: firmicutes)]|uniref:orotidine-5'-phosphate decarboxylase n=1 Tax=Moorella sp. E306M TaxID=2572683 RepID=UPI0010FFAE5F|nr:orotidine-5'-phosphate decarboxylase [Moorella sp. E306M]MDK2816136.1 orotidine-5-phosphate decarboxylase [Moorella sp. (in: firmicutes)]GEA17034.1 orotidine 5'-phosphate decarboxylase [Moorella sp. E306M]
MIFLPARDKIIVALDVASLAAGEKLVDQLFPYVGMFKVGLEFYTTAGPAAIRMIKERGGKVFADLKLHDIPNTVAGAARALVRLGVDMLNVHAAGGRSMMEAAVAAARQEAEAAGRPAPFILAVTVLTSLDGKALRDEVGIEREVEEQVVRWARLAKEAGLDGVVASPREIRAIREACGPEFLIVTPGVRPAGADRGDQRRVMTPAAALQEGASYLVIGRPITAAPDPAAAARAIGEEMEGVI